MLQRAEAQSIAARRRLWTFLTKMRSVAMDQFSSELAHESNTSCQIYLALQVCYAYLVRMRARVYACIYTCLSVRVHVFLFVCMSVCMYVSMHVYILSQILYKCLNGWIYVCMYLSIFSFVCLCKRVRATKSMCVRACVYVHICVCVVPSYGIRSDTKVQC